MRTDFLDVSKKSSERFQKASICIPVDSKYSTYLQNSEFFFLVTHWFPPNMKYEIHKWHIFETWCVTSKNFIFHIWKWHIISENPLNFNWKWHFEYGIWSESDTLITYLTHLFWKWHNMSENPPKFQSKVTHSICKWHIISENTPKFQSSWHILRKIPGSTWHLSSLVILWNDMYFFTFRFLNGFIFLLRFQ